MNWALYIVTKTNHEEEIYAGEAGVMMTNLSPGIKDTEYGVMYVAPGHLINDQLPDRIMNQILIYFGKEWS